MFSNFSEFSEFCTNLAKKLNTIVVIRNYDDYGWGSVAFMVDHFGGTYCNFHYNYETGVITDWYGSKDAKVISNKDELVSYITKMMHNILKVRNMTDIAEQINAEY